MTRPPMIARLAQTLLVLVASANGSMPAFADSFRYVGQKQIALKGEKLIVEHVHDWSKHTYEAANDALFSPKNDYSYIEVRHQAASRPTIRMGSPALSFMWLSHDEKFIVGLSKVKVWNPYQIVVFDTSGRLLYKRKVDCSAHRLSDSCRESVTNWVFWYHEEEPAISLDSTAGGGLRLSLRDQAGKLIHLELSR